MEEQSEAIIRWLKDLVFQSEQLWEMEKKEHDERMAKLRPKQYELMSDRQFYEAYERMLNTRYYYTKHKYIQIKKASRRSN